jgi:glycosyltransferase involved in cell wall biosynthesis
VLNSNKPRTRPLVSVITPTYNNDEQLRECIESVLAQSYPAWEYIIADDGSSDRTIAIAQSYAAKDPRIVVHSHSERLGVPGNWNRAFRYMSPESVYTKVVHGDDWLFPECIERMVEVAEAHPSAGVVGAYRLDNERVNLTGLAPDRTLFPGAEVLRATLLGDLYVFGSPTSTLIRTELIRERDPFYDESTLHADSEVCFELMETTDLGFVHEVLTFTRRHKGAVTNYASWLGTYRPSQIAMHRRYGQQYLSKDEYERRLAVLVLDHIRFLARRSKRLRNREFRSFHARAVREVSSLPDVQAILRGARLQLARMVARKRGRPPASGV